MTKIKLKNAFTLLELVIVIIIIGVLTSLAIPQMQKMIESSYASEAISIIASIRAGLERCYLMQNGSYENCDAAEFANDDWEQFFNMENPSYIPNSHFSYTVEGRVNAYSIRALRKYGVDGVDCYYISMGYGVKPTSFENGCGNAFDWRYDNKIYWDSRDDVSAFLPKTN